MVYTLSTHAWVGMTCLGSPPTYMCSALHVYKHYTSRLVGVTKSSHMWPSESHRIEGLNALRPWTGHIYLRRSLELLFCLHFWPWTQFMHCFSVPIPALLVAPTPDLFPDFGVLAQLLPHFGPLHMDQL